MKRNTNWLALCCCLMMTSLFAQVEELSWNADIMMRIKSLSSTTLSPDGSQIAYVVREPVMEGEKSEYLSHIWLAEADGSDAFQFTQGEKSCTSPKFSPDGKFLAFTSSRSGKNQVWMMRVRGGEAEQVTNEKNGVGSFQWSPDGLRIAFSKADPDTEEEEKAKKEKSYVIEVDKNFKHSHLYTITLAKDDEGNRPVQRLTQGEFTITGYDWSPDGSQIVFAHKTDPKINTSRTTGDIAIVPSDSGAVKPLITTAGIETNPKFSPNGQWIVYQSTGKQPEPIGLNDLYLIPADGGDPVALPQTPNRASSFLDWSDDGESVFVAEPNGTTVVAMQVPVNSKGTGTPSIISTPKGVSSSINISTSNNKMVVTIQQS